LPDPTLKRAFKLAREQNALSAWSDALELINAVVADAQIAALIDAPNVGAAQLEGVIIGAVGKNLSGEARNFVQVLVQNRRLGLIVQIRDMYEALRRDHEGAMEATVVSALPLADGQLAVAGSDAGNEIRPQDHGQSRTRSETHRRPENRGRRQSH